MFSEGRPLRLRLIAKSRLVVQLQQNDDQKIDHTFTQVTAEQMDEHDSTGKNTVVVFCRFTRHNEQFKT